MTETLQCGQCGRDVPSDSPGGLCPYCLIGQATPEEMAATTPAPAGFVPPSPEELAPLFPALEIVDLIGHGGMGAVYKARQTKLDRLVALKIIRPESADDPAFAERFNREARTLARLNHSGIVNVFDFGEARASGGGQPAVHESEPRTLYYFVMEYVDGVNLRQLLEEGRLPPEQALEIVPQVCDALQYAHEEGVIHRDVKPENILLDAKGRVKIADFGLAKLASRAEQDFTLTGTHQVMGTPRYMAPEQMEGSHAVDHRADIYSLGVVFYEMLTGQVPAGHFDPPSKQPNVDARLDEIVLRALARDPARRYQQASDVSSQLNAIRGERSDENLSAAAVASPPPGPSTMIEQAVGQVIDGIRRGAVRRGVAHPIAPGLVAILLGLGLVGTVFVPWAVEFVDRPELKLYAPIYGYDYAFSGAVGVLGFVLALALFAAGTTQPVPRWRGWLILGAGVMALVLVGMFRLAARPGGQLLIEGGFLTALGLAVALTVVGAWDLRRLSIATSGQEVDDVIDRGPRVSRKAIVGACLFVLSGLLLLLLANVGQYLASRSNNTDAISVGVFLFPVLVILLPAAVAGIAATVLGWLAISDIRRSDGRITGLPLAVADALGVPLLLLNGVLLETGVLCNSAGLKMGMLLAVRLAVVETIIVGGWLSWFIVRRVWRFGTRSADHGVLDSSFDGHRELSQTLNGDPQMGKDATERHRPADADDLREVEANLRGPALGMILVGGLIVIGHLVTVAVVINDRGGEEIGWLCVPGLISGLLMLVGGVHLQYRWSIGWGRAGAWAGLLPLSPGWLLGIFPSSGALSLLRRPEIQRGFVDSSGQAGDPSTDSADGGRDWVVLTREQIETDDLPDVCMVCGVPTTQRVNKDFSYQADWAQMLTLLGLACGFIPGMIVDALTSKRQRIACPVCRQHAGHWSRFVWWASTGWLIPVALGSIGGLIGWFVVQGTNEANMLIGATAGTVLGLIAYLVPLVRMASTRIDVETMTDSEIRLRRVSSAFARRAGGRRGPVSQKSFPNRFSGDRA